MAPGRARRFANSLQTRNRFVTPIGKLTKQKMLGKKRDFWASAHGERENIE
jgi:hypothetical protein